MNLSPMTWCGYIGENGVFFTFFLRRIKVTKRYRVILIKNLFQVLGETVDNIRHRWTLLWSGQRKEGELVLVQQMTNLLPHCNVVIFFFLFYPFVVLSPHLLDEGDKRARVLLEPV